MENKIEKNNSFINGAIVLTIAGIIVKVLGAIYKIPLGKLLGDVGASYQGFTYPYFNWAASILTAGFPIAIAKLISENSANGDDLYAEKVFFVTRKIMLFIGIFLSILLFIISPIITKALKYDEATYTMQAISFGIFFVASTYSYKGYFQGKQNLTPYAIANVLEQAGKVFFGLFFVIMLLKMNMKIEIVAAGSTFSACIGTMLSSFLLIFYHNIFIKKHHIVKIKKVSKKEFKIIAKSVLYITIPITIGAVIINFVNMIEGAIIIKNLQLFSNMSAEKAGVLYGYYSYYTASIINFPQILFTPITVSIFPVISSLLVTRNFRETSKVVNVGSKVLLFITLPCSVGLFTMSSEILAFLWPSLSEMVFYTSPILKIMSFMVLSLSIYSMTTNILNAMGKVKLPSKNLIIGAITRVVLCYILSMTKIGYLSAPIGSFMSFFVASVLNIIMIKKYAKFSFRIINISFKPILASLSMGAVILFSKKMIFKFLGTAAGIYTSRTFKIYVLTIILIAIISYIIFLKLYKCIGKRELEFLPAKRFLSKIFG